MGPEQMPVKHPPISGSFAVHVGHPSCPSGCQTRTDPSRRKRPRGTSCPAVRTSWGRLLDRPFYSLALLSLSSSVFDWKHHRSSPTPERPKGRWTDSCLLNREKAPTKGSLNPEHAPIDWNLRFGSAGKCKPILRLRRLLRRRWLPRVPFDTSRDKSDSTHPRDIRIRKMRLFPCAPPARSTCAPPPWRRNSPGEGDRCLPLFLSRFERDRGVWIAHP